MSKSKFSIQLKPPLVSVVVTVYNYERYVGDALRSVRGQSYENFECIIIDDASTDSSRATVEVLLEEFSDVRFTLIPSDQNLGQMGAVSKALEHAKGDFVCMLDADDVMLPDFVKAHILAHLNHSMTAGMSYCDAMVIDEDYRLLLGTWKDMGKERPDEIGEEVLDPAIFESPIAPSEQDVDVTGKVTHHEPVMRWHFTPMSGCMWRAGILREILPDDLSHHKIFADYHLAMMAASLAGSLSISKAQFLYRRHGNNNFASFPIAGGSSKVGPWQPEKTEEMNFHLLMTFKHKYRRFAELFGYHRVHNSGRRIAISSHKLEMRVAQEEPEFYRWIFQTSRRIPPTTSVRIRRLRNKLSGWLRFKK